MRYFPPPFSLNCLSRPQPSGETSDTKCLHILFSVCLSEILFWYCIRFSPSYRELHKKNKDYCVWFGTVLFAKSSLCKTIFMATWRHFINQLNCCLWVLINRKLMKFNSKIEGRETCICKLVTSSKLIRSGCVGGSSDGETTISQ